MICASVIIGLVSGNMSDVSSASLNSCTQAVKLVIYLSGSMSLWGGLMKIAEKAGVTTYICKILMPIIKYLFPGCENCPKILESISMNITANMLGLGNAATPLGIRAAKDLNKFDGVYKKRNISMLVVLNTASIQLIPSTIAALRLEHGAVSPFDITPAILVSSAISVTFGCLAVYAFNLKDGKKYENK